MANDIGGVWRTIGGRRVFIKNGQDLASAMKESGKFKSNQKAKDSIKKIGDTDINALKKLSQRVKDKNLLSQIQEETDSYAYKELLEDYNAGKVTTADLEDTLKTLKKFNGDNEDKISAKQFNEASKIDEPLERAIQMQVADDVGKTLNDDDIRFRAENYIKHNYNGEASTEEIYEKLKSAYKNNGTYENDNKFGQTNDDNYYKTIKDNNGRFFDVHKIDNKYYDANGVKLSDKEVKDFKLNKDVEKDIQKSDLMTAEQLKGKDRTEQKEINKQYLKEQNKLAQEKGLISDYNKTDSRGSMSDDSFIEQARKNGMNDEQIAKEVYKKHNGPESNNTSDNNIKRLLAKQAKEEAITKGDKKRAETFEKYEKNFEERVKNDSNFAKEWYEGTKKTENMAKENLERAKRNGASVEDLSNRTKQVHELELETQKAQEHANKMSARANSNNLENKYKISKTSTGKEYIRTISPYDETEYAYAEKRNDSWYVKDPTKKIGSGSSQTHIYNDVNEARAKMEEINNRIKGNSENSGKNYEGVTYNNYKKEEVNEASVDHRNESKTSSDVMNANIRNAYEEYKKKHPGSKINFSKFKDNYKS